MNLVLLKLPSPAQTEKKEDTDPAGAVCGSGKAAVVAGFGGNWVFIHNFHNSLESGKPLSKDMSYQKEQKPGLS